MRVCAHMNLGPHSHHHMVAATIGEAVQNFADSLEGYYGSLAGILDRTGEECAPALDLYPACDDCNSQMNFHDYPMARWAVGPRGGIRKLQHV